MPERAEPYFQDGVEEAIHKQLGDRQELLDTLVKTAEDYLTNTMFWLIETSDSCNKGRPVDVLTDEIALMFLNDMVTSYALVPYDEHVLRSSVFDLIRHHAIRMELKKYKGRDGSIFHLHTYVVRQPTASAAEGYVHQVDKFSFTAGMGKRSWEHYSPLEQNETLDFIYDVYSGAGDLSQGMDVKPNGARVTCTFALKQLAAPEKTP